MGVLFTTLCKYELAHKATRMRLRALKRRLAGEDTLGFAPPSRSAAPQEV